MKFISAFFKSKRNNLELLKKKIDEYKIEIKKDLRELEVIREEREIFSGYRDFIKQKDERIQQFLNDDFRESLIEDVSKFATDYLLYEFDETERFLRTKSRPAYKKAAEVKELKTKTREYLKNYNSLLYRVEILLAAFPELEEIIDDVSLISKTDDFRNEDYAEDRDNARDFLSKEEYLNLSSEERNQLALNRYIANRKTNWQVGRDFELYCGQYYENQGYTVEYTGTINKLSDLGRDLIARKDNETLIIQCKFWSINKPIREKHIAQLYGTSKLYEIETDQGHLFSEIVKPIIIVKGGLSDTAKYFAEKLNIEVQIKDMEDFPRIKCNINSKGEKIYHLPFDQQYDRTKINKKGEFYAYSVKEAEDNGFIRAKRYFYN